MLSGQPISSLTSPARPVQPVPNDPRWYALQTQPRYEKKVAAQLQKKAVTAFLPLLSQVHRWSDRRKVVQVPLFPGYTFVCIVPTAQNRVQVLRTPGVVGLVGNRGAGIPIPEKQIEDIQTVLAHNVPCALYPYLRAGQRVRICGGCLNGIEGILVARNADRSLVLSVEPILQSLAIRIEGYEVEILSPPVVVRGADKNAAPPAPCGTETSASRF